jgi:hypothetical protein
VMAHDINEVARCGACGPNADRTQANQVYEMRNFDQPTWKKAASRADAIWTTCDEIGYIPP